MKAKAKTSAELVRDAMAEAVLFDQIAAEHREAGDELMAANATQTANLLHDLANRVKFGEAGA